MNASNSNIPQKIDEAKSIVEINDLFDPIAGIGLTATLNDDKKLDVMTKSASPEMTCPSLSK